MGLLVTVHVVLAALLLVASGVVGVWGLARARGLASGEHPRRSRSFAHLLQLSHTLVLAGGFIGLLLLAQGPHPKDPLHVRVYGPFMVVAIIAAYGYRTRDAARNIKVFAFASLVIFALALRAVATAA